MWLSLEKKKKKKKKKRDFGCVTKIRLLSGHKQRNYIIGKVCYEKVGTLLCLRKKKKDIPFNLNLIPLLL